MKNIQKKRKLNKMSLNRLRHLVLVHCFFLLQISKTSLRYANLKKIIKWSGKGRMRKIKFFWLNVILNRSMHHNDALLVTWTSCTTSFCFIATSSNATCTFATLWCIATLARRTLEDTTWTNFTTASVVVACTCDHINAKSIVLLFQLKQKSAKQTFCATHVITTLRCIFTEAVAWNKNITTCACITTSISFHTCALSTACIFGTLWSTTTCFLHFIRHSFFQVVFYLSMYLKWV